ncbi:concanavalin A-like lectin/glucanase domain-containing protein [Truncatella angustata]|uniref:chitinase n=1 Tax=Truncatella angustata TaxID=152316 RepID=A0A9P8RKK7_9PEZI|nr:concanavalin A-like lectin/glucanase domain-containing protein [Truncatella angustata]KAH6643460.1 concanavalin A-like lectin/glucanase domain-containing protein [Truncatella angustata]KAH8202319.1 hypothetical protein TruAng_003491 [Truncatella angustata]
MSPRSFLTTASTLLVSFIATPIAAQLHTDCNPTLKTCPADPALGTAHTFNFNSTPTAGLWNESAGSVTYDATAGAGFTISEKGYSPTLTSNFYFFWGRTEVIMKTANGTGIISSIVYGSDDLDEVDWEIRGVDTGSVQSNYYSKGNTNSSVGATHSVTGNTQTEYHNYTNVWTEEKLEWWYDGTLLRTLTPAMANNSLYYPQTPMKLIVGIWAGGDSSQSAGTIEWAGGETDYDAGPYSMYVKSARVEDYSSGTEYIYGDKTGNSTSIQIKNAGSNSTAVNTINNPTTAAADDDSSMSEKWDGLSSGAKIGIGAGVAGLAALAFVSWLVYYIKQRKRGQQDAALAAKALEQERLELEQFKKEGRDPDALAYEGAEYNASAMNKAGMVSTTAYTVPGGDSRSNSLSSVHNAVPPTTSGWDPTSNGGTYSPMSPTGPGGMNRMGSPAPSHSGGYTGANNGYFNGNGGYR